jgi:arsenate reductase (thioredoxin)
VIRAADVIITMGCGDACPIFPSKRYEDWEVADPAAGREAVKPIRYEIDRRVKVLPEQLGVIEPRQRGVTEGRPEGRPSNIGL